MDTCSVFSLVVSPPLLFPPQLVAPPTCSGTVLSGGPLTARIILRQIDTDGDDTITWEEWLRFLGDGYQEFDQDSVIKVPVDTPPSDITTKLRDLQKIKDLDDMSKQNQDLIRQNELAEQERLRLQRLADQQKAIAIEEARKAKALQQLLKDKKDEELRKLNERWGN